MAICSRKASLLALPVFATCLFTGFFCTHANAQEIQRSHVEAQTSSFGKYMEGMRTKLEERGLYLQAVYTADVLSNLSGGLSKGTGFLDNLDLTAELDGSKLYGVEGSTIFIYLINNNGLGFNEEHVGSIDGVDNIEVSSAAFRLYEAWIQQNLWDDVFSLRVGLYDLNSEFDVTDSSGIFLNPVYGIDTAFAATGQAHLFSPLHPWPRA